MAAGAALLDRILGRIITRGTLSIVYADGQQTLLGKPEAGFPDVCIRLADTKVVRQIISDPRLGAGEAYIDGRLIIEKGDVMELVGMLRANRPWERGVTLHSTGLVRTIFDRVMAARESINHQSSAKANVAHHYDIGNALYQLMLDSEHMQYSCAYWPREDMTLGQAQEAKLAHIAAKLALEPGQRVLDIGCGWGGMAIYLAQNFDVSVKGITLSEEQLNLAEKRAQDAGVSDYVRFELMDYRDLAKRKITYDRIVSVGMFEHVGRPQFETFFRAASNLLNEDGVMLLHTIGRMGGPGSTDAFTRKYIFPGGYIPALSETVAASEKSRMIVTDVETLRLHYARTLRQWYARCMAQKSEIEAMFDDRFFRMWTFYLSGATAAFETGGMCNFQIQYAKNRRTLPLTRDYIGESERALLEEGSLLPE
ncbi:methyltransferase domain-containing protein [Altererythrobacter confluentis]|uniref:Methyltransferase domain-containing protein n=1 Tax=Allopontixanthobacter confluentis TaxID=1849021 RepID=A0A6L7GET3_9SPHN|nr:cyclopropane-fatty-acyl-phospholipid synthase family protein [Allopontixanthobacter confluentis]MXP14417.1 methyltransferase domain-containing protein [Allopontixanthobacter confluentis]